MRLLKVLLSIVLAVCFWYSVPYRFPLRLHPDPARAAANEAAAHAGNLSREIALPIVLLVSVCMLRLPRRGRWLWRSKLSVLALSYAGWAMMSSLWSTEPALTHKRLAVFCIDLLFVYALARAATMLEIAFFGFWSTGAVAMLALAADVLVLHRFAPLDPNYRFMGVMTANFQAMNLVICLLCGLTLAQRRPRWLIWLGPLLAIFAALLFLTRARVGFFLCVAMVLFAVWRQVKEHVALPTRWMAAAALLIIAAPALAIGIGHSGKGALISVLMMGRKDTQNTASLSNRAPLWAELMHSVRQHPVLGFGYEAFWTAERVRDVSRDRGWVVPHAHNTYLDQMLSVGAVGALLYACTLVGGCIVAWRRYRRLPSEASLLSALLLSWLALLGLSESIPLSPCLPVLIAYACLVKTCMVEGSEVELDALSTACVGPLA